jgi:hypothetical protein
VPAPASLVVSGRLARPAATLALAHEWTQLPLAGAEQLTELVAGEALGPIVDLDAPIDVAIATSGEGMRLKGLFAVSAGVKDPDNVRAMLGDRYKLVPRDNGVLLIQGLGAAAHRDGDEDDDDSPGEGSGDHRACEVAPSYGVPSIRLVCASDARALAELGPWLTRTATREAAKDDLYLDVRMGPLRSTLVTFRRMAAVMLGGLFDDGGGSAGAHDAAVDLGAELLDFAIDLDRASVAFNLRDTVAQASATATFAGSTSAITRLARAHADGGSVPPASFWQLPADADVAVFERGIDAGDLAALAGLALEVLDDKLEEDGVKEPDRKAIVAALGKLPPAAPAAYAGGLDPQAPDASGARRAGTSLLGWRLFALDEPPTRIMGGLKELATACARPGVVAAYAHAKPRRALSFRSQPLPAAPPLPRGSARYVLELPIPRDAPVTGSQPPTPPLLQVLVAPAGSRTWIGVGGDAASLASKLVAAIASPGSPRADLASLGRARVGAAGFFDVRGLPAAFVQLSALAADPSSDALAALAAVAKSPHKGLTPIPFSLTAQPDGSVVAALELPRDAVEDAIIAALSLAGP